jgi:hypothetical protein
MVSIFCAVRPANAAGKTEKRHKKTTAGGAFCSDPKKLDLTVVAFVAATVFIMLLHAATDIPLGLASPIVP